MLDTALALLPIFLLIVLGFWMKRSGFVPDAFWAPAEKTTYFITFPALLVFSTARAPLEGVAWGPLALASTGAVLAVFLVASLSRPLLGVPAATFTSVVQGSIRPNTYVGLAAAAALFGDAGVALTALCVAGVVPLVNVLAVATLVRHVGDGSAEAAGRAATGPAATLKGIVTNPLILACALGITLNVSGLGLPPVVSPFLEILGRAALPVGLLAVGAGLALDTLRTSGGPVLAASVLKLAGVPLAAGVLAWTLGLTGVPAVVAVAYAALPCSASSYVLARRMGGDAPCMAGIITFQTLAAAATLPLVIAAAGRVFGVVP
ncbi:Auxin Efflux Carrier [Caenispirillum salinarum AK4]|uniref:Auxin Efflux Carrier n=1 Tax=Caenispirillum salinarum AK4 TaxID=1238182 RepID=K9HQZ3_9PROT|nr:AEC family transporter [Caenispirillum salinarum]EKV32673.1 Auxin Efflux Carrier [Caenispirillum salinarum AK4]